MSLFNAEFVQRLNLFISIGREVGLNNPGGVLAEGGSACDS
jgi:hypothetical protein